MFKILPTDAGVASLIPGLDRTEIQIQGAEIPPASGSKSQNIKQKQYWNKFNKDFFKKWSTSEKKKKRGKGVFHTEVQWEGIGTKVLHF